MQEFGVIEGNCLMLGDRDRDKGAFTRAVTIENLSSKTIFTESRGEPKPAVSIGQFDQFQENLLGNYSVYREAVRRSRSLAARR
jgi:hypothetical protein